MAPELIEVARKLYEKTGSVHKVANKLGLGGSTVHRALVAAGLEIPARGSVGDRLKKTAFGNETVARPVADAYIAGESMSSIAARHGCSIGAVRTVVRILGVDRRPRGGQPKALSESDKSRLKELYKAGLSIAQVACVIGCNYSTVRAKLLAAGELRTSTRHASGERHGQWKGGIVVDSAGYVLELAPVNSLFSCMANSAGYVRQHRLRVAEFLGRPLMSHETVHHKDGNRSNNSLDNLQLRHGQHGAGVRYCCASCGSVDVRPAEL